MGYRQFEWECVKCASRSHELVWVDHGSKPPDVTGLDCPKCKATLTHSRVMAAPAVYTYDRPYAPPVHGGKYDTMGFRQPPKLPELPDGADFKQAKEFFRLKEYTERRQARLDVLNQNQAKKDRAKAMKKHPTMDIRNTPLPGDPKHS